jgi:fructose-1,6-bisphosphatase/inositol monophosphatase family enzyme
MRKDTSYRKELAVAKKIARKAGIVMRKYFFEGDQRVQIKEDNSPVTIADTKINRLVIEELANHFDDGVIGEEESTAQYGMGRRWFCDPIDGTKAFVCGIPTATFSLGLVVDGVPVLGVVYDPFLDMLYEGVKGAGSYCNGKRLHVSGKKLVGEYVAVTGSVARLVGGFNKAAKKLLKEKVLLATSNGAVYKSCLVARGKFVGYAEPGVNGHDMAAVQVIVEEAGGRVTGFDGKRLDYTRPFRGAVVSNKTVHKKLLESVR